MIKYNRYQDLRTYTDEELKELLKRVDMEKFILETQLLINKQQEIMTMDTIARMEIKDKKTLTRLLRNCYYVFGWLVISEHDGVYVKLQKTDLMASLLANDYDMDKFTYDVTDNTIYVN